MQDEQLELSRQLRPLLTRIYQMVRRRSPGWDVTAAQSSVLTTLMDQGKLRMGELAALEGVKMPTATSVVAGLVRIGLVERLADPNDRRRVLVDLTSDGRSQIAALADERDREFAALLVALPQEDRDLLAAAAPAMARLLAAEAADSGPAAQPA